MSEINIIHFDDDVFELEKVSKVLKQHSLDTKFNLVSCQSLDKFKEEVRKAKPDITVLDIHTDEGNDTGVKLARWVRESIPTCTIIMRSSLDDPSTIRSCLNAGADDFLSKKSDRGELCLRLRNSFELANIKRGQAGQREGKSTIKGLEVVGKTMEQVKSRVPRIISSAISSVFIKGESGTGKEVVSSIFESYLSKDQPFVAINCGAISGSLLESELFGHVKGAFTGANSDRKGLLESVNGGWAFFDEVATLSPSAQVALLRVLENGELLRVGSSKPIKIDVRIISATNENVEEMVKEGKFRKDLWQRINESTIELPPLSERADEISELIEFFCKKMRGGPYKITKPTLDLLCEYDWHEGNVRELRNCLRAMTEFQEGEELTPLSIPESIFERIDKVSGKASESNVKEAIIIKGGGKRTLSIDIDIEKPLLFDSINDMMLAQCVRVIYEATGKTSLRKLSLQIGIARSTLSGRLKNLVKREIMTTAELSNIINL